MASKFKPRACVVGAGISGLVAAKVLTADGFDVTVFERHHELGGVWASDHTYPGLRANNPKSTYAFSDYPYPPEADTFPTAEQVRAYLSSYADCFGLHSMIRLNTAVREVRSKSPALGGRFSVALQEAGKPVDEHTFDFVVVCNGTFSEPLMPEVSGAASFAGTIVHSSAAANPSLFDGKDVVVLGAGKSALDCACWAAQHARSATLIFRRPHWTIPRYLFGLARVDYLCMTRLFEAFLRYHRQSPAEKFLHQRGRLLVRLWWRILTALLRHDVGMPPEMTPGTSLVAGFGNSGVGKEFYRFLKQGKVTARQAELLRLTGDEAELSTGERIRADVLIAATGWKPSVNVLAPDLRKLVQRDGKYHLYRQVLPPQERHLGFIGYASSTASQLTSEISAHWLSQCFRQEMALPDTMAMNKEILRVQDWIAEALPERPQGQYIGPHLGHYLDELMQDMGLSATRVSNLLSKYFAPIAAAHYRNVTSERRRARESAKSEKVDDCSRYEAPRKNRRNSPLHKSDYMRGS